MATVKSAKWALVKQAVLNNQAMAQIAQVLLIRGGFGDRGFDGGGYDNDQRGYPQERTGFAQAPYERSGFADRGFDSGYDNMNFEPTKTMPILTMIQTAMVKTTILIFKFKTWYYVANPISVRHFYSFYILSFIFFGADLAMPRLLI